VRTNLFVDLRNPPAWRRPWGQHYGALLERFEEADRLGLAGVCFNEHHFWEDGYSPQPLVMAAAVAARTRRTRVGSSVMLAPLHPAVDIAEQAALVDLISDGRMMLGLGAGYRVPEFEAYGADRDRRFRSLFETAREVRRLWDEGIVTPGPVQERPPIWYGAMGPVGARRAGLLGEGLLWIDDDVCLREYRQGLADGGHDPASARMGGPIHMIVCDDPEEAWSAIKPHLKYHMESYARYGSEGLETGPADSGAGAIDQLALEMDPEDFRSPGPVMQMPAFDVVTPEDAIARLEAWCGELPVLEAMFLDSIAGMPEWMVQRHIELLATKVAPAIARIGIDVSGERVAA